MALILQSGYHELNKLRQQLKTQEAKCKKEVENIRTKIQELDDNSRWASTLTASSILAQCVICKII